MSGRQKSDLKLRRFRRRSTETVGTSYITIVDCCVHNVVLSALVSYSVGTRISAIANFRSWKSSVMVWINLKRVESAQSLTYS